MSRNLILFFSFSLIFQSCKTINLNANPSIVSIKDFGAKGNGYSNDTRAFHKASKYISQRGGNIELTIPAGNYIVGEQTRHPQGKVYLNGANIISLRNCNNVKISGESGTKLTYKNNLKYGSFNPVTGQKYNPKLPFTNKRYIAQIGTTILLQNCTNIQISNIEIDGNSEKMILGGMWGDKGRQLNHHGSQIINSRKVNLKNCNFHHFALDGIKISNNGNSMDNIIIKNSKFNFNGRQGLSWVGGNGLNVNDCEFNHTGRGYISSSPVAGLDIEASFGNIVKNGSFTNCEFINNAGAGMVAHTGPSSDVSFNNCTFWGTTYWSIWVKKPNFIFNNCNIYGSFVHGYITTNMKDATKFYNCTFEDKSYLGKSPYGKYLIMCDKQKLMLFDKCSFISNNRKLIWYNGQSNIESEQAIFKNCDFQVKNNTLSKGDFFGVIRRARLQDVIFKYHFAKTKKYYLSKKNIKAKNVIHEYKK